MIHLDDFAQARLSGERLARKIRETELLSEIDRLKRLLESQDKEIERLRWQRLRHQTY